MSESVENKFGYAEMQVVSFEDLFGGKLHAAMDRQHPRDIYDIKLLYEKEGPTEELFRTFLIYIACSSRPAHELLKPNLIDLEQPYMQEFEGMTKTIVSLDSLLETRKRLFEDIQSRLDEKAKHFLLGLHDGAPDFYSIGRPKATDLPAVRWKLFNLEKLKSDNPSKHAEQRALLEALFKDSWCPEWNWYTHYLFYKPLIRSSCHHE